MCLCSTQVRASIVLIVFLKSVSGSVVHPTMLFLDRYLVVQKLLSLTHHIGQPGNLGLLCAQPLLQVYYIFFQTGLFISPFLLIVFPLLEKAPCSLKRALWGQQTSWTAVSLSNILVGLRARLQETECWYRFSILVSERSSWGGVSYSSPKIGSCRQ
ncbi:hypothetical protein BKA67DRAFT_571151 [Truncatella angustata]|uniref:Uncharacterized protein n=1 Tax=Truncatella angustata TaxID=152316 RepID=A0A9P8UFX5_9PEZI|nr:uncharacterized protein BKA67DRAFT_571151 [Truncatella angustata]KAH6651532.1 hypothetical protein BKA67DRAFT_571151 [Truncatella angustata]